MNIVTGYRGTPHITANEAQAMNQGIFGTGNYVLDVGNKFAATLESATSVAIQDGEGVIQGVQFRIAPGSVENVSISPGTSGYKRIDYICARYTKNASTGIEDVTLVVVEGTPDASTPTAPTINTGDVLTGSSPVDFALWEVDLDGLTPTLNSLIPGYKPNLNQLGDWYDLPYDHTYNTSKSRLLICPATKTMIFLVHETIAANAVLMFDMIGQNLPLINGTKTFFYESVKTTLIGETSDSPPSFSTLYGSISQSNSSSAVGSDFYIDGSTSTKERTVRGEFVASYRSLHPDHQLSSATLII